MTIIPRLTLQARAHAVFELARRAGVPRDWIKDWHIVCERDRTVVQMHRPVEMSLIFPETKLAGVDYEPDKPAARFAWPFSDPTLVTSMIPDFLVPFSEFSGLSGPLFSLAGATAYCAADLLTATILTLARWEEEAHPIRDVHDRFPGRTSAAAMQGYLNRPIVDEYGIGLRHVLNALAPTWRPKSPNLRIRITHDIDDVSVPFQLFQVRSAMRRYRSIWAAIRQLASATGKVLSADLHGAIVLDRLRLKYDLPVAMYWMAAKRQTEFDTGYDPATPQIRQLIRALHHNGVEIGVHPSYYTLGRPDILHEEVSYLRSLLPFPIIGGRQHFLRWSPRTWMDWEHCDLAYDSSVGYHDLVGFRAGTSLPYRPWLMNENRAANVIEIPLLVMEQTLQGPMGCSAENALRRVRDILCRCRIAGGVFTMLWHNTTIQLPEYSALRKLMLTPLLKDLAGSPSYDAAEDSGTILAPRISTSTC